MAESAVAEAIIENGTKTIRCISEILFIPCNFNKIPGVFGKISSPAKSDAQCCKDSFFTDRKASQYVNRICLWSSQMASIFLIGDYRGVRRKIPLLNHPARFIRIIGDVLLYMALFVAAVMIAMILEDLF